MLRTFKDLKVWQKSYALCLRLYGITREFPPDERFGLVSQVQRAAVSVPSNIAEGYDRATTKDYLRFLWMSAGSLAELETQMLLAKDLQLCCQGDADQAVEAIGEIQRMLKALIKSLTIKESSRRESSLTHSSSLAPSTPRPLSPLTP